MKPHLLLFFLLIAPLHAADLPVLAAPDFKEPLLAVFDVPMPTTTRGASDVSTTPAQSIALMNSPLVIKQTEAWARAQAQAKPEEALRELFRRAFTREPGTSELNEFVHYSQNLSVTAHLFFNLKGFIFVP